MQFLPRDLFPEGTESFLATSALEDSGQIGGITLDTPSFLPPVTLSDTGTFIIIEDNERKFHEVHVHY